MRLLFALAALAAALHPASAQAEGWRHEASGVSVPLLPAGFRLGEETDVRGDSSDVLIQLGAGEEPVTLYVYRSAFPNPALWFERTRHAMNANVATRDENAAPRSFTLGDAPAQNGLREEVAIPRGARFRSTAVAIAQYGEWIVKARISSAALGREEIGRKMDELLAAIRFASAVPAPLPLIVPAPCADVGAARGRARPRSRDAVIAAAPVLALANAQARGRSGLAAEPGAWCRDLADVPAQYVSLYRHRDGRAWSALVADSGVAISAYDLEIPELPDLDGAATVVANPSSTGLAMVYDRLPIPMVAIEAALPIATGQQRAVAQVGSGEPAPPR